MDSFRSGFVKFFAVELPCVPADSAFKGGLRAENAEFGIFKNALLHLGESKPKNRGFNLLKSTDTNGDFRNDFEVVLLCNLPSRRQNGFGTSEGGSGNVEGRKRLLCTGRC